ncbi:MAG: hypothetical protein ACRCZF_10860 [Gemmataceae bacterium]
MSQETLLNPLFMEAFGAYFHPDAALDTDDEWDEAAARVAGGIEARGANTRELREILVNIMITPELLLRFVEATHLEWAGNDPVGSELADTLRIIHRYLERLTEMPR